MLNLKQLLKNNGVKLSQVTKELKINRATTSRWMKNVEIIPFAKLQYILDLIDFEIIIVPKQQFR